MTHGLVELHLCTSFPSSARGKNVSPGACVGCGALRLGAGCFLALAGPGFGYRLRITRGVRGVALKNLRGRLSKTTTAMARALPSLSFGLFEFSCVLSLSLFVFFCFSSFLFAFEDPSLPRRLEPASTSYFLRPRHQACASAPRDAAILLSDWAQFCKDDPPHMASSQWAASRFKRMCLFQESDPQKRPCD